MNRSELDSAVAGLAGVDRTTAAKVLDALDRVLIDATRQATPVSWSGLLSLDVVDRAARAGRNPQTGQPINIPAGTQVRLRPGSRLKAAGHPQAEPRAEMS